MMSHSLLSFQLLISQLLTCPITLTVFMQVYNTGMTGSRLTVLLAHWRIALSFSCLPNFLEIDFHAILENLLH